tara:strand:- start:53053 stop:55419 length:2367 start_codon:yes stop_codon:yes gene_type:complete
MSNLDTALTLKLVDQWSGPAKKLAGISNELAQKLSATGHELNKIGNQRKAVARLQEYELASKKAKDASNQAAEKVKMLRLARAKEADQLKITQANLKTLQDLKASGVKVDAKTINNLKAQAKENKTLIREHERAEKALEKTTKQRRLAIERAAQLRTKLKAEGIETRDLTGAQNRLGEAYARTQAKIKAVSQAHGNLAAAQAKHNERLQKAANTTVVAAGIDRVGRGALNAVSQPANYAISRESAFTEVDKFVKGANMELLSKQIKTLAKDSPMGAAAVAQLVAAGGKINLSSEEALKFAKRSEVLSVAYGITIDQASESIPKLLTGMNLTMDQVGQLGDAINHLGDSTASNAPNILDIITRVGSTAKAAGLAAPQIAALAAVIDGAAPSAEIAATSMKNLLLSLNSGEQMASGKQDVLNDLGFDSADIARRMQENAVGTIREVLAAIADRDAEERSGIAETLFGRESIAAVNSLVGNLEAYDAAMGEVSDSVKYLGSAEKERAKQMTTTQMKLARLQSNYHDTLANLGEKLLPTINMLAGAAGRLLDALNWLTEKFPMASKVAMLLVGGLGVLAVAIAPVLISIAALRVALSGLGVSASRAALQSAAGGLGGAVAGGGKSGKAGRLAKGLAGKAGLIGAGLGALSIGSTLMSDDANLNKGAAISQDVGGIGGALSGAAAGAALGSVVPVIGTAIGGLVGSVIGSMGGDWLGGKVGNWLFSDNTPVQASAPVMAAGENGGQNYADNSQYTINVQQQPGENADQLVKKTIDEIDRRKSRRRGASYADHG